jgi:hypothetical protein
MKKPKKITDATFAVILQRWKLADDAAHDAATREDCAGAGVVEVRHENQDREAVWVSPRT